MLELSICMLMLLTALACGESILPLFRLNEPQRELDHLVLSIALGTVLFSLMVLMLALCHILMPWPAWIILLVPCAASSFFHRRPLRRVSQQGDSVTQSVSVFTLFVCVAFISLVLINLVNALVPTVNHDTLTQFFVFPKRWIAGNAVIDIDYHFSDNFIFWTVLMHVFCMLLGSDILAVLYNSWAMGVLSGGAVYMLARRYFRSEIALLAAAIYYSGYVVTWLNASGKINLALALYEILAMYCFFAWKDSPAPRKGGWLMLAGIFAGYAAGIHIAGLKSMLTLAVLFASVSLMEKEGRALAAMRRVLLFSAISALLASPLFIRNYVTTGNPAFPMLHNVFGGRQYTGVYAGDIVDRGQGPPTLRKFATKLWDISVKPWTETRSQQICPLILAFFPLVLLIKRPAPIAWQMLGVALIYYSLWILTQALARYGFAFLALLSIVAAYTACTLLKTRKWAVVGATLAGIVIYFPLEIERELWFFHGSSSLVAAWPLLDIPVGRPAHRYSTARLKCALGLMPREEFLYRSSVIDPFHPNYRICVFINEHTPANAVVFGTSEEEKYWINRTYLSVREQRGTELYRERDPDRLAMMLREEGITNVLFSARYIDSLNRHMRATGIMADADFLPKESLFSNDAFVKQHLKKLYEDRGDILYEVRTGR